MKDFLSLTPSQPHRLYQFKDDDNDGNDDEYCDDDVWGGGGGGGWFSAIVLGEMFTILMLDRMVAGC